jgi:hypothetical protein
MTMDLRLRGEMQLKVNEAQRHVLEARQRIGRGDSSHQPLSELATALDQLAEVVHQILAHDHLN